jgi:hypothetical protein
MIRHHIRELDLYSSISAGVFSRRSLKTERALDDPIREMEGMHVDEYGRFDLLSTNFLLLLYTVGSVFLFLVIRGVDILKLFI